MDENEFLNMKRMYLLDDSGKIRNGITMKMYARILEATDEDEFDSVIQEILATSPENINFDEIISTEMHDGELYSNMDDDYESDGEET